MSGVLDRMQGFFYPRFPSLRTIIAVPAEIKYSDHDVATKKLQDATALLKKIKNILEDEEQMETYCKYCEDEIEVYISHKNIVLKVEEIVNEDSTGIILDWGSVDESVRYEYCSYFGCVAYDEEQINLEKLLELKEVHFQSMNKIDMNKYLKERLLLILRKADIDGKDDEEKIENYEEALSISPKRYSVVVKRDIDEIKVNLYNPEWILCWNGNMDIQPCLDFFGVITYITDYYMKDDSGTLKFIKEVLDKSANESIKAKLCLVKNTFLTHRQIGESEAYYKLFQHLHLSQSNISAVFAPTGFKKNRSRFLKQITEDQASYFEHVIEVEDKEGKFYIEKETMMDKLLGKPKILEKLTYSQFVKRFTSTKTMIM